MKNQSMKPIARLKPAIIIAAWKYPTRRPARMLPSPGKASWLMAAQTQALGRLAGLGLGGDEKIFVGIHQRENGDRDRDEKADTTTEQAGQVEQSGKEEQGEQMPPMARHDFAADF